MKNERLVAAIHSLAPRAFAELLNVVAAEHRIAPCIEFLLAVYGGVDPGNLAALGGDHFAPAPTRLVRGRE